MTSSIIGKSVVLVPSQTITQTETHGLVDILLDDPKEQKRMHSIVKNTNIAKRHSCIPIEKVLHQDTSPGGRHKQYLPIAREFTQRVAERALFEVNATKEDIDAIVVTSCTGFSMPSLGNYLISDMGFKHTTRVLPVAQWGCAGSVAALNWAHTHCLAYPHEAVLFVAVELCSLMYQPSDRDLSMMICNSLFGDAAGGVVIMGEKNKILERTWPHTSCAFRVMKHETFCPPDKMHYLYYDEDDEGWHFRLAPNVASTVGTIAPYMKSFLENKCNQDIAEPAMRYLVHTGGPKILQELLDELFPQFKTAKGEKLPLEGCNPKNAEAAKYLSNSRVRQIDNSLTTMRGFGNTSSVTVLTEMRLEMQAYERRIAAGKDDESFPALTVACGPGFTAEWAYGRFFARPVEKRSPTQSLERPVCFTMELPRIDVLVLGMSTTGAFLASQLCSDGLIAASVEDLTEKDTSKAYEITNDDTKVLKSVGYDATAGTVSLIDELKTLLLANRTKNTFVPFWEFKLLSISGTLDVNRVSRFERMNNDDVITVLLEHVPTGVTQQLQTMFVVATGDDESTSIVEKNSVEGKTFVLKPDENSLAKVFDSCAAISQQIAVKSSKIKAQYSGEYMNGTANGKENVHITERFTTCQN